MRNILAISVGLLVSMLSLTMFGYFIKPLIHFIGDDVDPYWIIRTLVMVTCCAGFMFVSWRIVRVISKVITKTMINIFFGLWALFFYGVGIPVFMLFISLLLYQGLVWFEIIGVGVSAVLISGFGSFVFSSRNNF